LAPGEDIVNKLTKQKLHTALDLMNYKFQFQFSANRLTTLVLGLLVCANSAFAARVVAATPVTPATPVTQNGVVTVGIPSGLPGYRILPGGEMDVLDARKKEVTSCIEGRMHTKFKWVDFPTKRLLQKLANAEVDVVYPMGFTAERASQFLQSTWAWQNPDVFVSLKPVDTSDLSLTLGSKLGSPQETDYVPDGYASVQSVYEYGDLPRMLSSKTVEAVIVPKSVFLAMSSTWPEGVLTSPGKPRGVGFYLNKRDPKGLLNALNESIGKCRHQGTPSQN